MCVLHSCYISYRPVCISHGHAPKHSLWNTHCMACSTHLCISCYVHVQLYYGNTLFVVHTLQADPHHNMYQLPWLTARSGSIWRLVKHAVWRCAGIILKDSHLDLQLWGGTSFRLHTASFLVNILKNHRSAELFLCGHFEPNRQHKTGGGIEYARVMRKDAF